MLRAFNSGTRAAPYQSVTVADIGDVNVNLYDLQDTCRRIREAYTRILSTACIPLTLGNAPGGHRRYCSLPTISIRSLTSNSKYTNI